MRHFFKEKRHLEVMRDNCRAWATSPNNEEANTSKTKVRFPFCRYLIIEDNMEGLINYRNEGLLKSLAGMAMHSNALWGANYLLMDSPTFMGKTGGARYDVIIDMFIKIWDAQMTLPGLKA